MTRRPASSLGLASAEALLERQRALERFSAWEEKHPRVETSQAALNAVGFLYDLLPVEARRRPVDTRGIQALHGALAALTSGE